MASSTPTHLLSDLVRNMAESETIKTAQLARDLRAAGHDVVDLSLGEPDFDTPEHIKEAAKKALDEGYTKYTPVPGLVELREAIVRKFKRDNDLHFHINQIVVSNGAKQSLANLSLALLNPGDEVIILAPYWVSYFEIVKLSGGVPVVVSAGIEQDFKVRPEQVAAAITPRTKAVLFSSPCNPTGSVYQPGELQAIADVVVQHEDILLISDEIYEYIQFQGQHYSIGSYEPVRERCVTVNGFAKGFAMTGWRLGYMGAPEWLAKACTKIQGQFTSGANSFGQKAAAFALDADMQPTRHMKQAFEKRRDLVLELLSDVPGMQLNHPQGAFYFFPDIRAFFGTTDGHYQINDSLDFCEYLLQKAHVATVAGVAFGAPECFRFSYATSEAQLREACTRIRKALSELKAPRS